MEESHYWGVVGENISFCNVEVEGKDFEELAFDSADITGPENSSAPCPMDILQCRVIEELRKLN